MKPRFLACTRWCKTCFQEALGFTDINPLLHRLFLDHDIIFYFYTTLKKKIKKNLSKVLNTFEHIMENEAFALKEQMLYFP